MLAELFRVVVDSVVDTTGGAGAGLPIVFLEPALDNRATRKGQIGGKRVTTGIYHLHFGIRRPSTRSTEKKAARKALENYVGA